jgi:nitroreductase
MTETTLASQAGYLIEVAGRAPSLHNTQPWRFTVGRDAIELHADPGRRLRVDPDGREIVISCGAALFGLRLAVRSLGRQPVVEFLPEPGTLARVRLGPAAPMTAEERKLLTAVPHRHTHRGPFEPGPLPDGLLDRLRGDARAEGATLVVVESADARAELASIAAAAGRSQDRDPAARAETRRWSHEPGSQARDGVPAHAFPATPRREAGPLPQRDFDLDRGFGLLTTGGPAPAVTAALLTKGDDERDWLRAGQALQRLLLRAASLWVFAHLNTQPLEQAATRARVRECMAAPGWPQMLLALGVSRTTHPTGRRPAADLT